MSETIKTSIHSTEALDQLSPDCIMEYLLKKYGPEGLIEYLHPEEMIAALGGIDQVLEDHPRAVQDHVANINASHEESAGEY